MSVDSTGLNCAAKGGRYAKKHVVQGHPSWAKLPVLINVETGEIQAFEVTGNDELDSPMLPKLILGRHRRPL